MPLPRLMQAAEAEHVVHRLWGLTGGFRLDREARYVLEFVKVLIE